MEGSGPAAGVRDGCLFARGWDPGSLVFLLLEQAENSACLVPDDGMQEGRREHWECQGSKPAWVSAMDPESIPAAGSSSSKD